MKSLSPTQQRAFVDAAEAIAEVIKHHTEYPTGLGLRGIPSGHLYARLMGHMSFDLYQSFIIYLKHQNIIADSNHLLTYVRNDQPFPETDDAIEAARRILQRKDSEWKEAYFKRHPSSRS